MSWNKLVLAGCAPAPLAHYLKALGILRLVSEQKDPSCRGAWRDDRFVLMTALTREELERFLLEEYRPTPMLSPWNGASGFYRTWDEKSRKLRNSKNGEALEAIVGMPGGRWDAWRAAQIQAVELVSKVAEIKDVALLPKKERGRLLVIARAVPGGFPAIDKDEGKGEIQRLMVQSNARNPYYASVLIDLGEEVAYPALWGTGGNDGAIDFTARFMEALVEVFSKVDCPDPLLLRVALWQTVGTGMLTAAGGKVGQYFPAAAGGANCTNGFGGQDETHLDPWDLILMLEGAVLFGVGVTSRSKVGGQKDSAAPFAFPAHAAGSV
jgi:CRISPR-associated protein Csx17